MSAPEPMKRVSRRNPCPICDKPDWCLVSPDGSAAICARISEGSCKHCGDAGYLHILRYDPDWKHRPRVKNIRLKPIGVSSKAFAQMSSGYTAAVDLSELQTFADKLGVSAESLQRLDVGWTGDAWSFSMRDAEGHVIGIRLRNWAGRKWAVSGSKDGLFIPFGLSYGEELLICEGPTDLAALLDLGFDALGRPCCMGGKKLLAELVRRRRPSSIVVFSDNDEHSAGQRGAESLASMLVLYAPSLRVIYPPGGFKDARQWKQAGATQQDVQAVIDAAAVLTLKTGRPGQ